MSVLNFLPYDLSNNMLKDYVKLAKIEKKQKELKSILIHYEFPEAVGWIADFHKPPEERNPDPEVDVWEPDEVEGKYNAFEEYLKNRTIGGGRDDNWWNFVNYDGCYYWLVGSMPINFDVEKKMFIDL
jgi:hypothetical protein